MGKTVTCELAFLSPSKTKNPHDYSRTPGGSSSGSAAVIASYMAPLSIGSQTGGSVIRPASYCGVFGFKPSSNTVSNKDLILLSKTYDTIGFFGKNINNISKLFNLINNQLNYNYYANSKFITFSYRANF